MLRIYALIGLGAYFALLLYAVTREKKNNNAVDFFFAGRSLPFWALAITFVASWWGAGSALSSADLAFDDGMGAFFYYGVPVLISTFLMILGAKAIRRVGYLTQGEMMEARYSKPVARMLALMILIFMTFNAAAQMVGIGNFFGSYLNLDYTVAILLGTIIVLIYSMFGGFRAVVLTDIIQFVLLTISAVCVFGFALYFAGGMSGIAEAADKAGKAGYMNMGSGVSKYFMYVVTFGCSWMIQANVWQRISAAKDDGGARKMAVLSFFMFIPLYLIVVITGMAGFAIYEKLPQGGIIVAIVKDLMSPVVGAIVFVGISAATMSTMDSLINTGAMTLIMDLSPGEDKNKTVKYSILATLAVSLVALLIAMRFRSILQVTWIASDIITTGVFVPLIMGFFWRRGTDKGALFSMIWGLAYCMYNFFISVGFDFPRFWTHGAASEVLVGVGVSAVVYIVVSLLTEPDYEKADKFIEMAGLKKKGVKNGKIRRTV